MVTFEGPESPVRSQRSTRNQTALYSSRYHPMDEVTRPKLTQKLRNGKNSVRQEARSPQTKSRDVSPEKTPDIVGPLSAHSVPPPSSPAHRRSQRASANVTPGAYNAKFHPMDTKLRPVRAAKTLGKRTANSRLLHNDGSTPSKRQRVLNEEGLTELTPIPVETEHVDDWSSELDTTRYINDFLANIRSSPNEDELAVPTSAPEETENLDDQVSGFNIAGSFAHSFATGRIFEPPCAYKPLPQSFVALHEVARTGEQYQVSSSPVQPSSTSQVVTDDPAATHQASSPAPVDLDMYDADDESDWSLVDGPAISAT